MFDSLKAWMTCPFQVKPFKGLNGAADKEFDAPVDMLGYFVGDVQVISDANEAQVVSNTQVYFDPSIYDISKNDRIIVDEQEQDIITITTYMDGNTGTASIKIAYL